MIDFLESRNKRAVMKFKSEIRKEREGRNEGEA